MVSGRGTPRVSSLQRGLGLLEALLSEGRELSFSEIAKSQNIPVATAYRLVGTMVDSGFLMRQPGGSPVAGPRLIRLAQALEELEGIKILAKPVLEQLARSTRCVAQLGTFEGDMVTYHLKVGKSASGLFTFVGKQLEAYCSGIGKMLLSHLPKDEGEQYLASGPFVSLTPNTITEVDDLRNELKTVRDRGYAIDDGEIMSGLRCLAVPIRGVSGRVVAAISLSGPTERRNEDADLLARLKDAAATIERQWSANVAK